MAIDPTATLAHIDLYEEFKWWATLIGALWAVFRGVSWVRDIREKDLKGLKEDVATGNNELRQQTATIASGFASLSHIFDRSIAELRSDFRTFYTQPDPIMVPAQARISRRARKVKSETERISAKTRTTKKTAVKKTK